MNKDVLLALAAKWQRYANDRNMEDQPRIAEEQPLANAIDKGCRIGLKSCADDLVTLIKILGD